MRAPSRSRVNWPGSSATWRPNSTTSGTVSEASFVGTWGTDDPHEPHLVIAADGTVTGSDGCNTLNGAWEFDAEDGTIEFDRMVSTMMACEGVDQSLGQLDSASVDGDTLTFYGDDDVELTTLPRTE